MKRSWRQLGTDHKVELIEGGYVEPGQVGLPHYFAIRCRCGWESKSYHGESHAREIAERHLFVKLHEIELTPGGQTVKR